MMKVIVVGCGRVGAELAHRLAERGNKVTVVDQNPEAFHNLHMDFRGRTVEGHVLYHDVIKRAGFQDADALAVVTSNDPINATVGHIGRSFFKIPNVVVRNFDSRWRSMHEAFGLQVVSSSSWGAQRLEELLYQKETRAVFSAGNGEVEIYEFTVQDNWSERAVQELLPDRDCILASLSRAGRAIIPSSDYLMHQGDVLTVSATLDGSEMLRSRLKTGPVKA